MTRLDYAICGFLLLAPAMAAAAEPDDAQGRDFPKTLTFDEPGIDDEISLPTVIFVPHGAGGQETDADFELDKRLTTRLSLQLNVGYSAVSRSDADSVQGWQDSQATLKFVLFGDRTAEQLVSISLTHEFGGSGAARIGASRVGSTTGALNFGQGFASVTEVAVLRPLAVTGVVGYQVPDRAGGSAVQSAAMSASLQYSFDVLMAGAAGRRLPGFMRRFIPIVECVFQVPITGEAGRQESLAPGLIYAGDGYQLAAEALVPLTRASGDHVGFIAQLNISLERFGVGVLAEPVF